MPIYKTDPKKFSSHRLLLFFPILPSFLLVASYDVLPGDFQALNLPGVTDHGQWQ
jgi:hypothetical protein